MGANTVRYLAITAKIKYIKCFSVSDTHLFTEDADLMDRVSNLF